MKLVASTALLHNGTFVNYEIFALEQMLVFKPYFYHLEGDFPCIVLNRVSSGWQFQEKVDQQLEKQIREDIDSIQLSSKMKPAEMGNGFTTQAWNMNNGKSRQQSDTRRAEC